MTGKPIDVQLDYLHHSTELFTRVILALARSKVEGKLHEENRDREKLESLLGDTLILSNLVGRREAYREADRLRERNGETGGMILFGERRTPVFPRLTFKQALDDLLGRTRKVVSPESQALRRGYIEVQQFYARGKVFALARSISDKITAKIQQVIEASLGGRKSRRMQMEQDPVKIIANMGNWSRAYGEVVYRTNMATSMVQGIKQMATDPDVEDVIGGYEYAAVGDSDTRHNHQAASGLIAGVHDPVWKIFTPPIGYNCRCTLVMVDRHELKEKGLIENGRVSRYEPPSFSGAYPDKGFPGYQG
tara:strand:- start:8458 stop:9375 length:918 start_codon:yes stop_codon:yes gene_type:complete